MHQNDVLSASKATRRRPTRPRSARIFSSLHMAGLRRYRPDGLFHLPNSRLRPFPRCWRVRSGGISLIREVKIRIVIGRPRNDQRRTRLVNQNGVHFVDNRKVETALTARGDVVLHVVAQIVKAELIIRAVRNVGRIGFFLNRSVLLRKNRCRRKARASYKAVPSSPHRAKPDSR